MREYRIPALTRKYTEYDMIQAHTQLPANPDKRVQLLFTLLESGDGAVRAELYALAASLAQIGLDTHDMVDNSLVSTEYARSRQLKVLAGDYFNSRFYYLLAQAGDVDVVARMARAICEVNRLKMNLYERLRLFRVTAEEYLEQTVSIKSELFMSFSAFIPQRYAKWWPELLWAAARCDVLREEMDRAPDEAARSGWGYLYIRQHASSDDAVHDGDTERFAKLSAAYGLKDKLARMLEEQVRYALECVRKFDSDALAADIKHMFESRQPGMAALAEAIEEV